MSSSSTMTELASVFLRSCWIFFFFLSMAIAVALRTFSMPSLDWVSRWLSFSRRFFRFISSVPCTRLSNLSISFLRPSRRSSASFRFASCRSGSAAIAAASLLFDERGVICQYPVCRFLSVPRIKRKRGSGTYFWASLMVDSLLPLKSRQESLF